MSRHGSTQMRSLVRQTNSEMGRIVFYAALLSALIAGPATAQNLEPAGRVGRVLFAIDLGNTSRTDAGHIQTFLYEVADRPTRQRRYALLAATYDCEARSQSVHIREEFSSLRDPVKTVYRPPLVTSASQSHAVAEQLRVVCGDPRPPGTMDLTTFLRMR
jgi:hypothetical protein